MHQKQQCNTTYTAIAHMDTFIKELFNKLKKHTWLNRRVNATTFGANVNFSLAVHAQLASSYASRHQHVELISHQITSTQVLSHKLEQARLSG